MTSLLSHDFAAVVSFTRLVAIDRQALQFDDRSFSCVPAIIILVSKQGLDCSSLGLERHTFLVH
jgi:hypothetical protein